MQRRVRSLALVVAVTIGATACFGSFNLTRNLYNWNASPDNQWVQEGYFLVTGVLLPVYGIATFADAVIFNSIEFWTGDNPVSVSMIDGEEGVVVGQAEDGEEAVEVSLITGADEPYLKVRYEVKDETRLLLNVRSDDSGIAVTDETGELVFEATEMADGSMRVSEASGATLVTFDGAEVDHFVRGILGGDILPSVFAQSFVPGGGVQLAE